MYFKTKQLNPIVQLGMLLKNKGCFISNNFAVSKNRFNITVSSCRISLATLVISGCSPWRSSASVLHALSAALVGKAGAGAAETRLRSLCNLSSPTALFQVVAKVVFEVLHSFPLPPGFPRTRKIFQHPSVAGGIDQITYRPDNLLLFSSLPVPSLSSFSTYYNPLCSLSF